MSWHLCPLVETNDQTLELMGSSGPHGEFPRLRLRLTGELASLGSLEGGQMATPTHRDSAPAGVGSGESRGDIRALRVAEACGISIHHRGHSGHSESTGAHLTGWETEVRRREQQSLGVCPSLGAPETPETRMGQAERSFCRLTEASQQLPPEPGLIQPWMMPTESPPSRPPTSRFHQWLLTRRGRPPSPTGV